MGRANKARLGVRVRRLIIFMASVEREFICREEQLVVLVPNGVTIE